MLLTVTDAICLDGRLLWRYISDSNWYPKNPYSFNISQFWDILGDRGFWWPLGLIDCRILLGLSSKWHRQRFINGYYISKCLFWSSKTEFCAPWGALCINFWVTPVRPMSAPFFFLEIKGSGEATPKTTTFPFLWEIVCLKNSQRKRFIGSWWLWHCIN